MFEVNKYVPWWLYETIVFLGTNKIFFSPGMCVVCFSIPSLEGRCCSVVIAHGKIAGSKMVSVLFL